jgi:hypothetical protein
MPLPVWNFDSDSRGRSVRDKSQILCVHGRISRGCAC